MEKARRKTVVRVADPAEHLGRCGQCHRDVSPVIAFAADAGLEQAYVCGRCLEFAVKLLPKAERESGRES